MAKMKNNKHGEQLNQEALPNIEEFFVDNEGEEEFHEGAPRSGNVYFDAALLPDTPPYQPSAEGNTVYILYVLFPNQDESLDNHFDS